MARRRRRIEPSGQVEFNATPMIDVTFLLIVFFIVAGRIASDKLAEVDVPDPHHSMAIPAEKVKVEKVIVNIVLAKGQSEEDQVNPALAGDASHYEISGLRIDLDDAAGLLAELEKWRAQSTASQEDFFAEIRADAGVNFGDVEPVLWAVADAGIPKIIITAIVDTGQ